MEIRFACEPNWTDDLFCRKRDAVGREKDPILFGAIMDGDVCFDRLYFICDWTDEFCDLTLDQLAEKWDKIHEKENRKFVHPVEDGRSFGQLKEAMKHYVKSDKKEDGFISTYSTDNQ